MARKKHHDNHDEEHMDETWLIPYADLLTLLLALFIVLFSMRTEDTAKTNAVLKSLYKAFNTISVFQTNSGGQTPSNNSLTDNHLQTKPLPNPKQQEAIPKPVKVVSPEEKKLQDLMKELQQYINTNHLNAVVSLTDLQEGIQITLKDKIVFDSGSDQLKPNFLPTLADIAGLLKTVDNTINIEGHTDNQPMSTPKFPSNWELSGARALSVLHFFQDKNINPTRLHYAGYGEYKPLYPNDTPEHREANRRVEIIIQRK